MPSDPGPFGWVSTLLRWQSGDTRVTGQGGPLPPPKTRIADPAEHEIYQGLADGWMHGTVGAALSSFFSEPRTRKELYVLFEKMDMTDVAGSFLDLIAEDATAPDPETGLAMWVTSKNEDIESVCNDLLARLRVEEEITANARDIAKFGDDFGRLVYRSGATGGIRRIIPVPPISIVRKEDKEGRLEGYTQVGKKFRNDNNEVSYPWDFVHFRVRGKDRRYPYGTSLLHNAIRPWKQLIVMEDWMLGYQISKHPDRNLILLDTGTASEVEAADVSRRFKQKLRKHVLIDPAGTTGRNMNTRNDPWTPMEDLVLPIRSDSATTVQKLSGSANATDIAPIMLTIQKFFSAVRAPKEFFGFYDPSAGLPPPNPKASLTNQDVRYARTAKRLQRATKTGWRFLCEMNLMLLMAPDDQVRDEKIRASLAKLDWRLDDNDFDIHMGPISFLEELERLEVEQTRQQVALAMMELSANNPAVNIVEWTTYIFRDIIKIPEDKLSTIIRSDMDPEALDNLAAGLTVDGQNPAAVGKPQERRYYAPRLAKPALDEIKAVLKDGGGTLSQKDMRLLAEAINRSPQLRRLIHIGKAIFREDTPITPFTGLLPDRDNDLFKKGLLKDNLTEADVAEIMAEARADAGVKEDDDAEGG